MLAANSTLETTPPLAAFRNAHFHQLPHSRRIERLEWISFQDFLLEIIGKKCIHIVATVTEGHLRQVVGTEAEKISMFGHQVGSQCGPRNFNHCADGNIEFSRIFFCRFDFIDCFRRQFSQNF